VKHFSFHHFSVVIRDGCETMVHSIRGMLNLHPDWAVLQVDVRNAFNFVSMSTIFQKLRLCLIFWINFFHLFNNFTHAHPHCTFLKIFDMEIS
jgi:hypothetical protein